MMRAVCDNMGAISGCYYLQLWQGGRAGHQAGIGLIVLWLMEHLATAGVLTSYWIIPVLFSFGWN